MHSLFWSSPFGRLIVGLGVFTFAFWALAAAALFAWSPSRGVAMAAVSHLGSHEVKASEAVAAPDQEEDPCSAMCDDAAGFSYDYSTGSENDDFAWAVMDGNGSLTIDGGEAEHVRANARQGRPVFWFRDGDDEFWVDDRAIVDQVRRATARVRELGVEMGKVGAEMGRHGAAMGRIGGRMGSLGARMGMVEARLATSTDLSRDEREREREVLRDLRDQLRDLQRELDGQRGEHARSQRQLSRRMSELSAQHQQALRDARTRVREISRRARHEGKAERPHANA
jgi:hypothetical protein